jgi:hypothetical protein
LSLLALWTDLLQKPWTLNSSNIPSACATKSKHIETALETKQKVVFTKIVNEKLADASNSDMDRNNSKNNDNG